jgi:hypothetical protein
MRTGTINTWKYEVFISHAGEDKGFATAVHSMLTQLGISAFLDEVRASAMSCPIVAALDKLVATT